MHFPCPEHLPSAPGHATSWHAAPAHPGSQRHVPSTHAPWRHCGWHVFSQHVRPPQPSSQKHATVPFGWFGVLDVQPTAPWPQQEAPHASVGAE